MKIYKHAEVMSYNMDEWLIEMAKIKGFKPISITSSSFSEISILYEIDKLKQRKE